MSTTHSSQSGVAQLGYAWLATGTAGALPSPPLDPSTVPWEATIGPVQVAPWRRRTRPPVFTDNLPIPSVQSISLVGLGLNHRKIGIPTLTGGAQGLLVFISGINESGTFAALSCNIRRQLGTTGTCRAVFNVDAGGFEPELGASIVAQENNRVLFSGLIIKRTRGVYPNTSVSMWTVTGVDWNGLLQRHVIAKDFVAGSLLGIAGGILTQPSIIDDRISTDGVDPDIEVGDDFSFNYIKMSDAFGQLALSTNTIWWIDNYKVLRQILAVDAPLSDYSVTENGQQVDPDITVDDSLDNYRNTQYVRAANQLLSETVTVTDSHTFSGTTGDIVCITRYPLVSAPFSVLENNVEIVNTDRFFELKLDGTTVYPPGGEGWYWTAGSYGVWHWPSPDYPTAGTTLAVSYNGVSTFQGNVVKYQDSAQILAMQALSGGSGVFEEIEDYSGSLTYSQALALAQGIEQGTAPPPQVINCGTIEIVEDIGYAVVVNIPRWGVSGTYVIQQIERIDAGRDLGKGTRFRTRLQLVSTRTLGNFTQYWERLYARLNKAFISPPTEKPTWALAFDTPGSPSSGLAVGDFGAAYPVQTGLGRIQYVSIVFETAADANIVINIKLNGDTIFSTLPSYAPGDTGTQVLYGAFNPNRVNVQRGDLLALSVVSCGTLNPGKNGTVIVVIGQR